MRLPETSPEDELRAAAAGGAVKPRLKLGLWLMKTGTLEEARGLLEGVISERPEDVQALSALAKVLERLNDAPGALVNYARAAAVSGQAEEHRLLGDFLQRAAADAYQHAAVLDPEDQKAAAKARAARGALASQQLPSVAARARPSLWPDQDRYFADIEGLVRRFVLPAVPRAEILSPATRIVSMGSCFAEHIAARLAERGYPAVHRLVREDMNSTYATRYLMDWLCGEPCPIEEPLEALYGPAKSDFRASLAECELFVLSIGVAPALFDGSGQLVLRPTGRWSVEDGLTYRTTSPDENVRNIVHVIERVRQLSPAAQVVLTISPVPLGGALDNASAVLADCLSKSVLRVAVETVMRQDLEDVRYWPSFEIVRWLGAHLGSRHPPAFAANDGKTRHVSLWLQDLIIRLFVEWFSAPQAVQPAPLAQARH
jgi:hypothetical protein